MRLFWIWVWSLISFVFLSSPVFAGKADAVLQQANELARKGKYEEALKLYENAARTDPNDVRALLTLGVTYSKLGKYEQAITTLKKAAGLDPGYPAFYNLGLAYAASGDHQNALDSLDQALKSSPKSYEAHYQKGNVYMILESYDKAIESYQASIKAHPRFDQVYVALAGAYYRNGKRELAVKQAEELKKMGKPKMADAVLDWIKKNDSGTGA